MAILNNLIVNGSARILNKIFCKDLTISNTLSVAGTATFLKATDLSGTANNSPAMIIGGPVTSAHIEIDSNEIHAKASGTTVADLWINSNGGKVYLGSGTSLYAENGGFHTTDLNSTGTITSVNINNSQKITSYDGYFRNNLRATYFDLQYVAELGGAFYVSPTIIFTNPTNFTIAAASTSGYTYQITIQDASLTTTTISGITWKTNAKIKASGTIDGVVTGTMQGIISSITANSSTHKMIIQLKDGNVSSLTTGNKVGKVTKFSVMVYNIDSKPVGILLNCYGQNDKPTIDLYGGTDTNPNVAIGLLTGRSLPKVGGVDPTGWGIYTSNGFFSGTIYSTSGNIAGWSISTSALYKGTNSTTSTTVGLYLGTDGIRNYKDANNYVTITNGIISAKGANLSGTLSAGAGSTIGPWTISATAIYKTSSSWGNSSTGAAYFGNDGISITDKFKVSSAGELTSTSGTIGGFTIGADYLQASGVATRPFRIGSPFTRTFYLGNSIHFDIQNCVLSVGRLDYQARGQFLVNNDGIAYAQRMVGANINLGKDFPSSINYSDFTETSNSINIFINADKKNAHQRIKINSLGFYCENPLPGIGSTSGTTPYQNSVMHCYTSFLNEYALNFQPCIYKSGYNNTAENPYSGQGGIEWKIRDESMGEMHYNESLSNFNKYHSLLRIYNWIGSTNPFKRADIEISVDGNFQLSTRGRGQGYPFYTIRTAKYTDDNRERLMIQCDYIYLQGRLWCSKIYSGSGSTLVIGSDDIIYKTSSSIRYKDIKSDLLSSNIESIYNIQPKIAKYKQGILSQTDQANGMYMPMFIAQDVYKYCPEAVIFNQNGEVQDWNFRVLLPVMFQMIKDQKKQIQELKKEVNNK